MAPTTGGETIEQPGFPKSYSGIRINRLKSKWPGFKTAKKPVIAENSIESTLPLPQFGQLHEGLLTITPCPYLDPLNQRLEPRDEVLDMPLSPRRRRSPDTISTSGSSMNLVSVNREKALNQLEDMKAIQHHEDAKAAVENQRSVQLSHVARMAAKDSQAFRDWESYMKHYSKNQYNLNDPPEPPARRSTFKWLPAIFPPQEQKRMQESRSLDILWPKWSKDKARSIINDAMKEFDTCCASISFFDDRSEIFKIEYGYGGPKVSRPVSIAAHALLSNDVLVLLDTKEDWRFDGNPLVCHPPNIRFFAGAPMFSSDGLIVGVFAVFANKPRVAFDVVQRQKIVAYSAKIMSDIIKQAMLLSDSESGSFRSTPLLERDFDVYNYQPANCKTTTGNTHLNLVPSALNLKKTPPTSTLPVVSYQQPKSDMLLHQTPYSSSEGYWDGKFPHSPRGSGKKYKQSSINSELTLICHGPYGRLITLDSDGFRKPTPRPFSGSDLTSFHGEPPNTPVLWSQDRSHQILDVNLEDFSSISRNDCAEQETPLYDPLTPDAEMNNSLKEDRQNLTFSTHEEYRPPEKAIIQPHLPDFDVEGFPANEASEMVLDSYASDGPELQGGNKPIELAEAIKDFQIRKNSRTTTDSKKSRKSSAAIEDSKDGTNKNSREYIIQGVLAPFSRMANAHGVGFS